MREIKSGDSVEVYDGRGNLQGYAEVVRFLPKINSFVVRFNNEAGVFTRPFNQVKPV
jgi:hypothetical protein